MSLGDVGPQRRRVVLQVQRVRPPAGHRRPGQAAQDLGHQGRVPDVPGALLQHNMVYNIWVSLVEGCLSNETVVPFTYYITVNLTF